MPRVALKHYSPNGISVGETNIIMRNGNYKNLLRCSITAKSITGDEDE